MDNGDISTNPNIGQMESQLKLLQMENQRLQSIIHRTLATLQEVVHFASETSETSEKKLDGFDSWARQKLIKENEAKEAALKSQYYHIQRKKRKLLLKYLDTEDREYRDTKV